MPTTDLEISHNQQEKFEFYLISLVFTLLALSIQTASFGQSATSDIFELLGWAILLISGIAGLWRMEYLPVIRNKMHQRTGYNNKALEMKKIAQDGATELHVIHTNSIVTVASQIEQLEQAVNILDPVIKNLEASNNVKYQFHRWCFVLGLISLVISRSIIPINELINAFYAFNT